jgi:hypothetical protein
MEQSRTTAAGVAAAPKETGGTQNATISDTR